MKKKINTQKKLLLMLWENNPNCVNCKLTTTYYGRNIRRKIPNNAATIQHFYPINHPARKYCNCKVLFCRKCNMDDNRTMSRKLYNMENDRLLSMLRSSDGELKILAFKTLCSTGIEGLKGFFRKNGQYNNVAPRGNWEPISRHFIPSLGAMWDTLYCKELDVLLTDTGAYIILWKTGGDKGEFTPI